MSGWTKPLFLVLLVLPLTLLRSQGGPPVHPDKACGDCHLAGGATTSRNAAQLTRTQESLCGTCHPGALTVAHPTGFQPGRLLPAEYPLDWKGDVTCSTCHEIHRPTPGRLRGDRRHKELCLACHEPIFFEDMADEGLSIQRSAHIAASPEATPGLDDPFSHHCLGCHMEQSNGRVRVDDSGILHHGSGAANHPIGGNYAEAVARGDYHPAPQLAPQIVLPDGKISCVSCHRGFGKAHGALVMSNAGSALCLECHDL